MSKLKITLAQIKDQKNLKIINDIVRKNNQSQIIVFPEGTITTEDLSEIKLLKALAVKYKILIIIGVEYHSNKKTYDFAYYISRKKVERYQKVHVHWTENHEPGGEFKVIKSKYGKIGFLMCYDAAFIESSVVLKQLGADIIVIISSIPHDFKNEYFNLRLRAIAYYTQSFVVHCCKPGHRFSGHSSIVNPKGRIIKELGKYKTISTKEIDLSLIKEWWRTEKIEDFRKEEIYKKYICNLRFK
ncbi:MAG: carbon-nitrogen hydrolase family protein [Patescibacteria group bacterium]